MKRVCSLFLALVLVIALMACGKSGGGSLEAPKGDSAAPAPSAVPAAPAPQSGTAAPAEAPGDENSQAEEPRIPGTLYPIGLKEGEEPVIRGIYLCGNIAGSEEFNRMDYSTDGIRCIFELSEWVEIYLDTDEKDNLEVWVLKNGENRDGYGSVDFSDEMPGFAARLELEYPEDDYPWGSFYLDPEYAGAGYYDLVFTRGGKAAAVMVTRFYPEEELRNNSDAELEKIESGLEAQ